MQQFGNAFDRIDSGDDAYGGFACKRLGEVLGNRPYIDHAERKEQIKRRHAAGEEIFRNSHELYNTMFYYVDSRSPQFDPAFRAWAESEGFGRRHKYVSRLGELREFCRRTGHLPSQVKHGSVGQLYSNLKQERPDLLEEFSKWPSFGDWHLLKQAERTRDDLRTFCTTHRHKPQHPTFSKLANALMTLKKRWPDLAAQIDRFPTFRKLKNCHLCGRVPSGWDTRSLPGAAKVRALGYGKKKT
jgi:hypothetical protein